MAYSLLKIANIPNTSYSFFKADTVADMNAIPTEHLTHGSECLVIATGTRYILNSSKEWVEQPSSGGGGGGGGSGENGATFTPAVSAEGIISWTNDKNLPNPESVNIKGPAGQDGAPGAPGAPGTPGTNGSDGEDGTTFTPSVSAAGVISWTNDGNKQNPQSIDLAAAVIAALPLYDGSVINDDAVAIGDEP